jgi:tetratricopeptide (TPR) repeat protein
MTEIQDLNDRFQEAYKQGRFVDAVELSAQLVEMYERSDDHASAAEMKNNRSVALFKAGDAQAALEAAEGTDKIFAAAGDPRRQGIAFANQATALESLGKLDNAAARYQQAADLFETTGDKEMRSYVMKSLASIYMRQGKQMDTIIAMQDSLAGKSRQLSGPEKFLKGFLKKILSFLPW